MAKLVILKSFMDFYYDNIIEKSTSHKYIRRVPKSTGKGYNYFYPKDFKKPMKALLSLFGMKEDNIDRAYTDNNIREAYGVTKQGFAQHVLEYLTNRKAWNTFFANKANRDKYKVPEKPVKETETVKVSEKLIEGGKTKEKVTVEEKETKEKNFKSSWNRSLMRKIYSMYNKVPEDKIENKAGIDSIKIGDSVSYNGRVGKVTKDLENGMMFVNFENGSMGRFAVKDLQKMDVTTDEVTESTELNAAEQNVNGTNESVSEEIVDTTSLSDAMMGNQNARKDIIEADKRTAEEIQNIEKDKEEFNELVNRLNELNKEFTSNGGYSYRRTTPEEDIKRRAAQKEIRVVEDKLVEFRKRMKEENKDSFKIPVVYHDGINDWIKRKVKGQTISAEWLRKKFGGYYSDALSFGDGFSFSLGDTDDINNPSVRINYERFGSPSYVTVNISDMDKEQYRPRYMPDDDQSYKTVWEKLNILKEQLNNTTGSTMAEKFFNMAMGTSNAYNVDSDTSNIPRYRFTKDGIKDKSGNLEKINANIREDADGNEYIRLYADNYGSSIPSIFYPENNTDIQTDYFEKDTSDVTPDHPYYNHLKVMALKNALYRGRATKWAAMPKEQQDEIVNQIKELEKQLKEPTEEELKAYREKRDVIERNKEILKQAQKAEYYRQMEQRRQNSQVVRNEPEILETEEEKFNNRSEAMMGNDNAAGIRVVQPEEIVETEEITTDELETPIPTIDANVAARINDISMSGRSGEVYQHDVKVEMNEFKDKFNYEKMNPQQKDYFRERLNSYAGLVGSSYNEMANKRLAAGPSWIVAGPAKYNTKRFNQKMDAERRAYETFTEKKDKFIKNTEKRLKELKYTGGTDSVEDVKKKVFEDYSNGNWSFGDKIDNTDPYAIEKVSGKIKFIEDAHDVTLMYGRLCSKNGISNVSWTDRTDEDKAKRKEVLKQAINAAKEKGYSDSVIKEGIEHPFTANQTAEIRRNKQRLEELQKRKTVIDERKNNESGGFSANNGRVDFDGGYIFENPELDRIQIIYDGKPERDVIDKLKHNGFRWSPSQGAWQRQLNRNGRMAVNRIMSETDINTRIDIDGAGEVKKSLPLFIIRKGRFLIRK